MGPKLFKWEPFSIINDRDYLGSQIILILILIIIILIMIIK